MCLLVSMEAFALSIGFIVVFIKALPSFGNFIIIYTLISKKNQGAGV